jgi:hypothetical protein
MTCQNESEDSELERPGKGMMVKRKACGKVMAGLVQRVRA